MLIRNAEVEDRLVDVRLDGGKVTAVGAGLSAPAAHPAMDAAGGALLPGLHDHHCHLRAMAAAASSVDVSPTRAATLAALGARLAAAGTDGSAVSADGWVRAVGYHESVGLLDRDTLDGMVADRPVRVQHRSGSLWVLNSPALRAVGLGDDDRDVDQPSGVERDGAGRPTGRLWRADRWLAERLRRPPPDGRGDDTVAYAARRAALAAVGATAARQGVTGFTDCTPDRDDTELSLLAHAHASGALPQRLHLMVRPDQPAGTAARLHLPPGVSLGPAKLILDDESLPSLDWLVAFIVRQHEAGRATAIHAVTTAQLVLAAAAFGDAGARAGDRIEHAAMVPADVLPQLAGLGLTVVTQPNFVAERGEAYRRDVPEGELADLWRARSLIEAGVDVAAGTDSPFGGQDPWAAIGAAVQRRTSGGAVLGAAERVDALTALDWFLADSRRPWQRRRVRPGVAADLCLLRVPLGSALAEPDAANVRCCLISGQPASGEAPG